MHEDSSIKGQSIQAPASEVAPPPYAISQTPRHLQSSEISAVDNTNKNFKGQQKTEVVLCFCRKHWIVLFAHLIGFFVFLAAVFYFFMEVSSASITSFFSPQTYKGIAALLVLGFTYYIHRFFLRFFNYYLQTMIITNYRVIELHQTLYFVRQRNSIDLPEIQDIIINREGVIPTLLNYGEITIILSSAHATKTFYCVPNPEYFFRKINKTKREYIMRRRMEKTEGEHAGKNARA